MNVNKINYRTIIKNRGINILYNKIISESKISDLMIFCKCNGISESIIKEASKNCITIFYMMDAITHLKNSEFYNKAQACDITIVTTIAMKKALKAGGVTKPIYHIIQGIDPEEFKPIEVEKKYNDFVFIGTKSPKRDEIIGRIKDLGYSIGVYGDGYGAYLTGDAFNKVCAGAKICLAINNTDADIDSFSDRILRYMATGACVLTEYSEGLENYFTNFKDLVWFKDNESLVKRIKFLMENIDTRNNIAQSGYKKVLENYTWDKVVKKSLLAISEVINGEIKKR